MSHKSTSYAHTKVRAYCQYFCAIVCEGGRERAGEGKGGRERQMCFCVIVREGERGADTSVKRCASTALHALMSASHPPGDAGAARIRKAKAAARPCSRVSPRRKPPRASLAPSQPSSRPSRPAGTTSRAPCLPPSSPLSSPLSLTPRRQALTRSTSTGAASPSPPGAVASAQEPSPRSSQPAGAAREHVDAAGAPLVLSERRENSF